MRLSHHAMQLLGTHEQEYPIFSRHNQNSLRRSCSRWANSAGAIILFVVAYVVYNNSYPQRTQLHVSYKGAQSLHRALGYPTPCLRRGLQISRPAVVDPRSATASAEPISKAVDVPSRQVFEATQAELTDPAAFKATTSHKLWCGAHALLAVGLFAKGLTGVHTSTEAFTGVVAVVAGYVLSDLGTGIFHWSVDNYGDKRTPFVGNVIDSFQGHHRFPWTITKREWQNNVQMVARPVAFPTALALLLPLAPPVNLFLATFSTLIVYSQQFHAWAHMKARELPGPVLVLQDAGLLVSRRGHGQHHKPPFEGNYCIVSGMWNEALDKSGFLKGLETVVERTTGIRPRCWDLPHWKVQEEAPVGWDQPQRVPLRPSVGSDHSTSLP